jgi:tetratricopeptide (TPR) repeat protein
MNPSPNRSRPGISLARGILLTLPLGLLMAVSAPAVSRLQEQSPSSQVSKPPAAPVRFDFRVREDFFRGFAGDAASLERGMAACEAVLKENPRHAEALVWHGGGLMFQSRKLFQAGKREEGIALSAKGLAEMDSAVKLQPDQFGIRIVRAAYLTTASRYVADPDYKRGLLERVVEDYEITYRKQETILAKLSVHQRGELLMGLSEAHMRLGNAEKARTYLEIVVKTTPDSPYAKEATAWLAKKTDASERETAFRHACVGCHTTSSQQ